MQFLLGMGEEGGGETRKVKGSLEVDKCICLVSFQARFFYYYHYQYLRLSNYNLMIEMRLAETTRLIEYITLPCSGI